MGEELQSCQRGGGRQNKNTLGAPAVATQTKPGDPLQVELEPVVLILYPKQKKNNSDYGGDKFNVWAHFLLKAFSWTNHPLWRGLFTWF